MSDQNELNPADRELEAALKSLTPIATRLDPVSAAYEAGRRSVHRQLRIWRAATAALMLVSAGMWLLPRQQNLVATHQPVLPTVAIASPTLAHVDAQSMAMLRKTISEKGVEGLSPVQLAPPKTIHIEDFTQTHRGES